jgi:hypothetical protein
MRLMAQITALCILLPVGASALIQPEDQTVSNENIGIAQKVVICFFDLLSNEQYAEAAELYGGSYRFHLDHCFDIDPADYEKLWSAGCGRCGLQCFRVRDIEYQEKLVDGRLYFNVILVKKNGETLVIGPCCGETEEESPPDSIFKVFVKEYEDGYRVVSTPPFKP